MTSTRARKANILVPQGAQGIQGTQGLSGSDGTSVTIKGQVPYTSDLFNIPPESLDSGDGYIVSETGIL